MSLAIKPYSLEVYGMWHRLVETTYFPSRILHLQAKKKSVMTITLRIGGDSRSIVVFEEAKSNHTFGLKSKPNSKFFWM